jgi:hypothetical protein
VVRQETAALRDFCSAYVGSGVILRKSRIEHIWYGLPQIATVNADMPIRSVSAPKPEIVRGEHLRHPPLASVSTASWAGRGGLARSAPLRLR